MWNIIWNHSNIVFVKSRFNDYLEMFYDFFIYIVFYYQNKVLGTLKAYSTIWGKSFQYRIKTTIKIDKQTAKGNIEGEIKKIEQLNEMRMFLNKWNCQTFNRDSPENNENN